MPPVRSARLLSVLVPLLLHGGGQTALAQTSTAPLMRRAQAAVLDSVRAVLRRSYVDADTGRRIADVLSTRQKAHAYDSLDSRQRFASAVTTDLRSVNGDVHLGLLAAALSVAPATDPADTTRGRAAQRANFGLRTADILEGNIGYLEVSGFLAAPGSDDAVANALRKLEHTDAIIIDLRRNGGGSGEMSHLLFSHFLPATPVPTIRVRDRRDGTDTTFTSLAHVPGPRRESVPLYVLTSRRSASAAEEFAFVLRHTGRATLVGERTAGAGHMNALVNVGEGLQFSVSTTRVSHPTTGAEWERVGVAPHVEVPAATALDTALRLIRAGRTAPR